MPEYTTPTGDPTLVFADDHTPDPADVSAFAHTEDDDPQAHMGDEVIG